MRRLRTTLLTAAAVAAAAGTVWIALPASAASATATVRTVSDWGSGWQSEVVIDNAGTSAMTSWKVEFDLPAGSAIGSFWEADLAASGAHRTFTSRGWNGAVPVGGKVTFGFVGSGAKPVNCKLNGAPCAGGVVSPPPAQPTTPPVPPADPPKPADPPPAETQPVPPASATLPLTVTNKTGRGDQVFLYVLGTNLSTGKLGYVDTAGAFHNWTGGQPVPVPAPDVALAGPANGGATTIKIPKGLSGRLYISFGKKLDFRLSTDGLVQPAPWAGADPNRDILFDWSEFTLNDAGLWLNSSQVDMFAVPHVVSVRGGDGRTIKTGEVKPGGRQRVINELKAQRGFEKTVQTRSDGTVLRVLAPGKAADAGLFDPSYLDASIAVAWNAYTTKTLTVTPFGDRPDVKYFGRTTGTVLNFTDGSGRTVASFNRPSTSNVWGCDGALGAPNDQVVGPIARTLCAALHRSTLGTIDTQPGGTASDFYKGSLTNHYSRVIHENMVDGKAYGFAFDDVQAQESLVHSGDPRTAGVELSAF